MTGDGSENAVGQPVEIRLSRVALKALADLPDMACGYLSPLARIGAPKGPSQREPLVAALEMMRGPWEWAVPALLDPHMTVALLLGDGETTLAGQYLWPDADGAGPGFKAAVEGQELRIEGPVDLLQVEQYLLEFLSLSAVPEIEPVRLSLNRDEFWATLALADGYRTATLRRKLAREGGRPLGIAVRDVVDAWQTGIASPNPGWSVSLFAMLAPAALPAGFQIRLPEVLETMGEVRASGKAGDRDGAAGRWNLSVWRGDRGPAPGVVGRIDGIRPGRPEKEEAGRGGVDRPGRLAQLGRVGGG